MRAALTARPATSAGASLQIIECSSISLLQMLLIQDDIVMNHYVFVDNESALCSEAEVDEQNLSVLQAEDGGAEDMVSL